MSEGKYLSTNGLHIYYEEYGQGRPLILLHGATDNHKLWKPFIPEFSKFFRVIAPDTRGHGRTLNPSGELSYQVMADDLAEFIQTLELEKPLIFGYSDGGQTALDFGMRYPDIPGALVIGGAWFKFSPEYQASLTRAGFVGAGEIDFQLLGEFAPADWRDRMKKAHPHPESNYAESLLKNLATLFWTPLNYKKEDFQEVSVPTLILIGELDEIIPLEESREMAALIPDAEFVIIPGADHGNVVVQGGECMSVVRDFLIHHLD